MDCKHAGYHNRLPGLLAALGCPQCRADRRTSAAIDMAMRCRRSVPEGGEGLSDTLRRLGLDPSGSARSRVSAGLRRRRASRAFAAVSGTVAAALAAWVYYIDLPPSVHVPSPTMPQPNAFDTLNRATRLVVAGAAIDAIETARPRDAVAAAKTRGRSVFSLDKNQLSEHLFTQADIRQVLAANKECLDEVRKALTQQYMEPPARSYSHTFPHYAKYRSMARLLALEAEELTAERNYAGALSSALDAIALGRRIPHGGPLIGKLVGVACESIGRVKAWQALPGLDAATARAGARRLEALMQDRVTMADTLREELWMGQAGLAELMAARGWRSRFLTDFGGMHTDGSDGPSAASAALQYLYMLPRSKQSLLDGYTHAMERNIALASTSWQTQTAAPPPNPNEQGIIEQVLMPVYTHAGFADINSEAGDSLLLVALALQAYHQEHHSYPAQLSDLVPAYIKRVPLDPFSPDLRGRLRYGLRNERYLLYSVGPNGTDEGGSPAVDTSQYRNESSQYVVKSDSQGDIVAGINTK